MSKRGLDNYEYDKYLSDNKKERELRERRIERKNANKGYEGWHFGIDAKPVHTRNKEEFRRELEKRGLAIKDEYQRRGK